MHSPHVSNLHCNFEIWPAFVSHQVAIACEVQKPLLAHERGSHQKFIEVLSQFSGRLPSIVIHCFTGSVSEMSAYVSMGFYIGICGFICKGECSVFLEL